VALLSLLHLQPPPPPCFLCELQEVQEAPKIMGPDALIKQKIKQTRFRCGDAMPGGRGAWWTRAVAVAPRWTDSGGAVHPVAVVPALNHVSCTWQPSHLLPGPPPLPPCLPACLPAGRDMPRGCPPPTSRCPLLRSSPLTTQLSCWGSSQPSPSRAQTLWVSGGNCVPAAVSLCMCCLPALHAWNICRPARPFLCVAQLLHCTPAAERCPTTYQTQQA
jgi:hypothetical protein